MPGAGHVGALSVTPDEWSDRVTAFLAAAPRTFDPVRSWLLISVPWHRNQEPIRWASGQTTP